MNWYKCWVLGLRADTEITVQAASSLMARQITAGRHVACDPSFVVAVRLWERTPCHCDDGSHCTVHGFEAVTVQ